jgi:hypothetical protein
MIEDNLVCTFSGGRTSAFMAIMLKARYPNKNIIFLFANTSKEKPKTIEFINLCDSHFNLGIVYLEAVVNPIKGKGTSFKVVNFDTLKMDGSIFEDVIRKYGLPSKLYRHCTRELKERVIKKYADATFGKSNWIKALGIRADEKHRLKPKKNTFYPLAEMGVTKTLILNWWARQSFDLEVAEEDGNCDLCFLKSKRKRLTVLKKDPVTGLWWADMELFYESPKQPMFDVRNNLTVADLVALSMLDFVLFNEAPLSSSDTYIDINMDVEFSCYCSDI